MLNANLREQVIVILNGKMLSETQLFGGYNPMFVSEIAFLLLHCTFSVDDRVVIEGAHGSTIFFLTNGRVIVSEKASHTLIKELQPPANFGEVSFFTANPCVATVRSNGFSECLMLRREPFLETAKEYEDVAQLVDSIFNYCSRPGNKDFRPLGVTCFLCEQLGHLSVHCDRY